MPSDLNQQQTHWRDRIAEQTASSLTMAEFCRQQGLCVKTFYRWKVRLNLAISTPSALVPMAMKPKFLTLQAPSRQKASLLSVRLSNGVRISVFDLAAIPALLAGIG